MNSYSSSVEEFKNFTMRFPVPAGPSSAVLNPVALIFSLQTDKIDLAGLSVDIPKGRWKWEEIDPDQLWYWAPAWQLMEFEAENDLQNGDYDDFQTMDDFIESLGNS